MAFNGNASEKDSWMTGLRIPIRSKEEFIIAEDQSSHILQACTYHRKDYDMAVIWFPPNEHAGLESLLAIPPPPAPSDSRGHLGRLPLELFHMVASYLDIQSIFRLRQANRATRRMIGSLSQYCDVVTHALNTLCAVLRTEIAPTVTLLEFHKLLCEEQCELCGDFGHLVHLLAWSRVCLSCIRFKEIKEPPTLLTLHTATVYRALPPGKAGRDYRVLNSLRGTYSLREIRISGRQEWLIDDADRLKVEAPNRNLALCQNFMVCCAMPTYNPGTKLAQAGVSCAGCVVARKTFLSIQTFVASRYFQQVFTTESFLRHFAWCEFAQNMWRSLQKGSMTMDDLPAYCKNGGEFAPRESRPPVPRILAMQIDLDNKIDSEYRIGVDDGIWYLVIAPGTLDRETLLDPLKAIPLIVYTSRWFSLRLSRNSANGDFEMTWDPNNYSVTRRTQIWHELSVSIFDLVTINQLTDLTFEASCTTDQLGGHFIVKSARFRRERDGMSQEMRAYRLLLERGVEDIAPRFLGNIQELRRALGFILEKIPDARPAGPEDLAGCRRVLGRLHEAGMVHCDVSRHSFLVSDCGKSIKLIGFRRFQEEPSAQACAAEMNRLTSVLGSASVKHAGSSGTTAASPPEP